MKLDEKHEKLIKDFLGKPDDATALYHLGSVYWEVVLKHLSAAIRDNADLSAFLTTEYNFINYGLCDQLFPECKQLATALRAADARSANQKIMLMSDFIEELLKRINAGNRKESFEREINLAQMQIRRGETDNAAVAAARRQYIETEVLVKEGAPADPQLQKQFAVLDEIDALLFESLRAKKSMSKGIYFSVEQKREHISREKQLQEETARLETLLNKVTTREQHTHIRSFCSTIIENYTQAIDLEEQIKRLHEEIDQIEQKQKAISPVEIEASAIKEIDYLHDLLKLAAKRLRMENCSLTRDKEICFSLKILCNSFERIVEFDPLIFQNDRVPIFGKPSVLLVPGNGNALFDWKNNQIIVPLVPPGGNFMMSVATGMIEYRLDVDEDKRLTTSYNNIADNRDIRSILQLRAKLAKDYVTWMTSEYTGFRVLPKDIRAWFEHEIGPAKNEIYTPPELQQFSVSTEEYKLRLESIEARLKERGDNAVSQDLWNGHIFLYQQGKFDRAVELLKIYLKQKPQDLFALYNLGQLCAKTMRKQEAADAFNAYAKLNPQSWWAINAREHVRKLMVG